MVVVGGLGSLPGAVVGACLLVLVPELARGAGHLRTVLVGLMLYLSILLLPKGLVAEAWALRRAGVAAPSPHRSASPFGRGSG